MPTFRKKKYQDWPEDATDLHVDDVRRLYESGFAGAKYDPDALPRFRAAMPEPDGEMVAHKYNMAGTGAGKLVIPFVHVLEMFPGCWPGKQGQGRGDCVSWGTRNSGLTTMTCDIVSGQADEVTGEYEGPPDVPPEGIADGVLSTEAIYWYRGYDGDGWSCPDAAVVACKKGALMIRQNYPDLGFDLTRYNSGTAGKYGRKSPPPAVEAVTSQHIIHKATDCNTFESARDFLYNGYGVSTCGDEGLADTRDANGVSHRSGNWSHAMAYIGADDRPWAHQTYGGPLVLDLNSWAAWNKGPRDIFDSAQYVPPDKTELWKKVGIVNPSTGNIMIPEGSTWVRFSEMKSREMIAFCGAKGWKSRAPVLNYSPW